MNSGLFPARILTPPPIRLIDSTRPATRQIIGHWLESRRAELLTANKLTHALSFIAYANFGAAQDSSKYALKLAFDGLGKLYEGKEFMEKACSILDHMVKNALGPFELGRIMQRTNSLQKNDIQPIGVPALLAQCFSAART